MKLKINTAILLLMAIIIFIVAICFAYEIFINKNVRNDATIEVVKESVTPESATIIVRSDDPVHRVGWEDPYKLQVKKFFIWVDVKLREPKEIWPGIGFSLDDDRKKELGVNYGSIYGKLKKGTYRIVRYWRNPDLKSIKYYSDEFKIK